MTKASRYRRGIKQYILTIEVSRDENGWTAIAKELKSAIGVQSSDKNEAIRGAMANGLLALVHQMRQDQYRPAAKKWDDFESVIFEVEEV